MIRIETNLDRFEYDIRSLVSVFYPGETESYEISGIEKPEGEDIRLDIKICWMEETGRSYVCVQADKEECRQSYDVESRVSAKTAVKRCIYEVLSALTKKTLPWGCLTGIRPTKIPMALLYEGKSDEDILSLMKNEHLVSDTKARLSLDIAKREKSLLEKIDYDEGYSLYIGIPFCPSTCLYCSFTSYPISMYKNVTDNYLECLFKELSFVADRFKGKHLNTIYIGGGTPTTLSAQQLDRLCSVVEDSFDLSQLLEFTVEAGRPDSVTPDKLDALKKHRVDRISINPQTMKEETLKIIGRHHTVEQVREVYALARQKGFDNINMDLILGLPNEDYRDVTGTFEELLKLSPDNLTVHSLALKRAARLNIERDKYREYTYVNSQELMDAAFDYAGRMGMSPYYLYRQKNMAGNLENVGFAKEGKAGIYNILIMEEVQTIVACGAGSTTKRVYNNGRIERCENVKDVKLYIEKIDEMINRKDKLFAE